MHSEQETSAEDNNAPGKLISDVISTDAVVARQPLASEESQMLSPGISAG